MKEQKTISSRQYRNASDKRLFQVVGIQQIQQPIPVSRQNGYKGKPVLSALILGVMIVCCLGCELIMTKEPGYMDLGNCHAAPSREFLFGTDSMGRDIFSMVWYGGRISLFLGIVSAVISAAAAIVCGAVSGNAPKAADALLMRLTDILLSVPQLLAVIFVQAVFGKAAVLSLSFVIGITSWMSMAKIIRTQVRQLRYSEYVTACECMGGGFFHILWRHLTPNFLPSVMFMTVMNIRNAIMAESALSFMGIGLPIDMISWGSMLSMADQALSAKCWWVILIPGLFLTTALACFTNLGNYLRKRANYGESNL